MVEHFACVEVLVKYWQHFVREMQYELDLVQTEFDELELAPELVVHQNQPSQKTNTQKQNEFFLLKKCKGAICGKRLLLKNKQSHNSAKRNIMDEHF